VNDLVRVSEVQTTDRLQMFCEHISLALRQKTSEMSAVCTNDGRLFQMVECSMRTDEQRTVLTVGLKWMISEHIYVEIVDKYDMKVVAV